MLLPQILLGIITYVYDVLFTVFLRNGKFTDVGFLYSIWRWWFLPVLFVVTIIFYLLSSVLDFRKKLVRIIILVADITISLMFIYVIPYPEESPFYLNVVPMAFLFYFIGFIIKPILLQKIKKEIAVCAVLGSTIVCWICSQINSPVTMFNNNYGNIVLFAFSSLAGICLVWMMAILCEHSRFCRWFGINSIIVYVWQFKLTELWKNLAEIFASKISVLSSDAILMTVTAFAGTMICVMPIVWFSNRYVPFLYGRNKTEIAQ